MLCWFHWLKKNLFLKRPSVEYLNAGKLWHQSEPKAPPEVSGFDTESNKRLWRVSLRLRLKMYILLLFCCFFFKDD